jgi:hypothetical protein
MPSNLRDGARFSQSTCIDFEEGRGDFERTRPISDKIVIGKQQIDSFGCDGCLLA